MIKESTRAYITIYVDYYQFGSPIGYFVIKNFGQTAAIIQSIEYNQELTKANPKYGEFTTLFDNLSDSSLSPNQKILIPFDYNALKETKCNFDIKYKCDKSKYKEHIELDVSKYGKLSSVRVSSNNLDKNKLYTLQEIAERLN